MSELLNEISKRRARRAIDTKQVPIEVIERIMTGATYAPSCFNNQPWRFILVNEQEALEKVKTHLPEANYWVKKSPLIIMAVTDNELDCRLSDNRNYAFFDLGLSVENLILQAVKEGLIAHPIAGFKPVPIKEAFGIPGGHTLLTLIVLGYPGDESHLNEKHLGLEHSDRDRKPLDSVVMYNRWDTAVAGD